jgi:ABC-type uncharacterized transport system YnjBCD substrate-binding protein
MRSSAAAAAVAACLVFAACGGAGDARSGSAPAGQATIDALASLSWDSVVSRARGTEVLWRMWRGDPSVNAYVDQWVMPRVRDRYGIALRAVEGQGAELVNELVVEREAGRRRGSASLVWINGETFGNLRREGLLAGPWASRLPAAAYVDSASPIIRRDFEQDPAGYESPWGRVQFALIYDSVRTPAPPHSFAELATWIRAHPGRFTIDEGFAGSATTATSPPAPSRSRGWTPCAHTSGARAPPFLPTWRPCTGCSPTARSTSACRTTRTTS